MNSSFVFIKTVVFNVEIGIEEISEDKRFLSS
jgi:hypothetical protein